MQRDKLAVLIIFTAAVLGVIGFEFLGKNTEIVPPAPLKPSSAGEFRGISLQLHNSDPNLPYETYVDQIARTGANTICLVPAAYQENGTSTTIFIDARKTVPNARLQKLIERAHSKGLRVVLMPIVLLVDPGEGEWRGSIAPKNWADWWGHYDNYIMQYAYLAEAAKADVLMIGSELLTTERQSQRWRDLIAKIRAAYRGRLSYSANWDHFRPIDWWQELDMIGMTTYHDLTGGDKPTIERLMKQWQEIKKDILSWQAKVNRKILFTEVGWPNLETCAQYPWDYTKDGKTAPRAQANCFEAFFRTWIGEKQVAGFLVWEWRKTPWDVTSPDKDTSYVPCDKPAMDVIKKYYQYPSPSSRAATQPAGPPGAASP